MLKKIFAALAGALALIAVPPTGEAERQLPIVLDLDDAAEPGDDANHVPVLFAWLIDNQ